MLSPDLVCFGSSVINITKNVIGRIFDNKFQDFCRSYIINFNGFIGCIYTYSSIAGSLNWCNNMRFPKARTIEDYGMNKSTTKSEGSSKLLWYTYAP